MPSLKQDLFEGRAITNGLNSQVFLDKNTNICGNHHRINNKLCGDEQSIDSIPFISDDLRLFRPKALHLETTAEVSRQPLNKTTNEKKQWFYSRRQKKRKHQSGNRDGQKRLEDRSAAIIKHFGVSRGYDRNDKHQHITSCAVVM